LEARLWLLAPRLRLERTARTVALGEVIKGPKVQPSVSINGKSWGRPDDTIGVAGVINGISNAHIAFLNAGGLGILIGDGQLPNYGTEKILEAYYSYALTPRGSLSTISSSPIPATMPTADQPTSSPLARIGSSSETHVRSCPSRPYQDVGLYAAIRG
jgi:hypothetical protein